MIYRDAFKKLPFFWMAIFFSLLSILAQAKVKEQKNINRIVNPGMIEGYGPVTFRMNAPEAFRAAGRYAKYEDYEGMYGIRKWRLLYPAQGHGAEVYFRDNESIMSILVHLHAYSKGTMPMGECFTTQFDVFSSEFSEMFPDLSYIDESEVNKNRVIESRSRTIAFSDGSRAVLNVSFLSSFADCKAKVLLIPSH